MEIIIYFLILCYLLLKVLAYKIRIYGLMYYMAKKDYTLPELSEIQECSQEFVLRYLGIKK